MPCEISREFGFFGDTRDVVVLLPCQQMRVVVRQALLLGLQPQCLFVAHHTFDCTRERLTSCSTPDRGQHPRIFELRRETR